jgi:1-acyl-sn-glycerol-3-phosphate acyltransferase
MKKWIARWFLKRNGWGIEGEVPKDKRFVLIAAPHTSNWDLPYLLAFAAMFDLKVSWLAKHSLFFPPMGWILRALGGVPVVRHEKNNVVDDMVEVFKTHQELVLVVPTEGTRARTEFWKSGFYHIAVGAGVPIVPSYLDFGNKRGGFAQALIPSGNLAADMDHFRAIYADKTGKFPEMFGPVRLKEERRNDN